MFNDKLPTRGGGIMAKTKSTKPKLFKRDGKGNYLFRRFINGKNTVINTGTDDQKKAEAFRSDYIKGEGATAITLRHLPSRQ